HGKLLGVVVVGGQRRRAVRWQAGGSRRLPELDEARKGCVVEYGVKLGDASGESFVLPGGQTWRSVDAAAQGAAHGIGYNSRATMVLLVTTTGMFCDKALWSIVSRQKGSALQPGRNRSSCGAIYVFSELGGKVDRKRQGQHEGHWSVAQARQQGIGYTGAGRVDSREIRSGWSDRALPISFMAGGKGTVRQTCLRAEVVAVKENKAPRLLQGPEEVAHRAKMFRGTGADIWTRHSLVQKAIATGSTDWEDAAEEMMLHCVQICYNSAAR
ncbi:unnamed protein product, partial [Durusdinium trenchii]